MVNRKRKSNADIIRARCLYVRVNLMRVNADTAAKEMGYRNTSVISKMEKSSSRTSINHNYIQRLAEWASVSLDFIYGYSDYPERDPQTVEQLAIFSNAKDFTEKYFEDFGKLLISSVETNTLDYVLQLLFSGWKEFSSSWEQLLKLNPRFNSTAKGGARLVKSIREMNRLMNEAVHRSNMIKHNNKRVKQFESALQDVLESKQIDYVGFYGVNNNGK